eukprot:CAMPEP_0119056818 /NCGR_PEP_ID=MMETSP1178-20130426/1384_1 /TAXON_ID=33656 /ORGANISM="unid sp, Strain CCMP2000" /LENGTH=830 /DNA_ID=CAMNT_0007037587 /DNA_START=62 /DNA_END=2554 /DNA_ORIENTATION=-
MTHALSPSCFKINVESDADSSLKTDASHLPNFGQVDELDTGVPEVGCVSQSKQHKARLQSNGPGAECESNLLSSSTGGLVLLSEKNAERAKAVAETEASFGSVSSDSSDTVPPELGLPCHRTYGRVYGLAVAELAADVAAEQPLGFAIVGMGRAGKIHLACLQEAGGDATVRWLVDTNAEACPTGCGAKVTADLLEALSDEGVTCVIVSTPTPHHAPVIRAALEAGKHVFAEKPLCCGAEEAGEFFALAEANGSLLHTAYNRRSDPSIQAAREEIRSGAKGRPLGAMLVSRDYPYPLTSYLAVSGNIFKDCVVHDLDYLTWLLDDQAVSLRAHASAGRDDAAMARACGMWEYSEVHLTLRSGATATLINGRVSDSYEHRLDIYCEHGVVRVANPHEGSQGVSFADRFAASYRAQLAAFRRGVRAVLAGGPAEPNLSLSRTQHLEELVLACEASVAQGGMPVPISSEVQISEVQISEVQISNMQTSPAEEERLRGKAADDELRGSSGSSPRSIEQEPEAYPITHQPAKSEAYPVLESVASAPASEAAVGKAEVGEAAATWAFRSYDERTAARVKEAYRKMRGQQSVEHVRMCHNKYCAPEGLGAVRMSVWEALATLDSFVDLSDPDISLPNSAHAFQCAEGLRAARMPDWLQLTGLIHDMGKMVYLRGCDEDGTSMKEQWSIVGDTWIVGCQMPPDMIYPELNASNPDGRHPQRTSPKGIYEPGCGLDNTLCAFGHDEYMYQVLVQNEGVKLPPEALSVVRYHSLYPWHEHGCYAELENEHDRCVKGWVKLFNQHDLYTKRDTPYSEVELAEMRAYYSTLIDKYLPAKLDF